MYNSDPSHAGIVIAILVIVIAITVLVIIIIIVVERDKQRVCPEKQVDEKKEKPVDEKQCSGGNKNIV